MIKALGPAIWPTSAFSSRLTLSPPSRHSRRFDTVIEMDPTNWKLGCLHYAELRVLTLTYSTRHILLSPHVRHRLALTLSRIPTSPEPPEFGAKVDQFVSPCLLAAGNLIVFLGTPCPAPTLSWHFAIGGITLVLYQCECHSERNRKRQLESRGNLRIPGLAQGPFLL
jgi:hypothetical protein